MFGKIILCLFIFLGMGFQALAGGPQNIPPEQAREMLQQDDKPFLLDVRTPPEYFAVRLGGATLIPIDQFPQRDTEVPRNRPILVYCAVGARSSRVAEYLAGAGFGPVYNLSGGIRAWQQSGFPVAKGAPQ